MRLGLLLLCIFLILSLFTWKAKICFNPDELFYYKSSQTLSNLQTLYAPEYYGTPRFQKPPLFYSMVFVSFKLLGINWFSARMVTVISSILVLLVTYLLGRKMFDEEKAFFATGILSTTVLFFRFGRIVLPEMTLILFMVLALFFAYKAFHENKRKDFYLTFLFMGIATLVKGPIGFILPVSVIAIFNLLNRKNFSSASIPWVQGFFIVLAFVLLWVVPVFLIYGEKFLGHIMTAEIADRMTDKAQFASVGAYIWHYFKNVSFYVPVAFAEYMPWSVLFFAAFFYARKKREKTSYKTQRSFLLIWIITGFIIFTLIPKKRAHYVLLFFPALSLYLISFFDFNYQGIRKAFKVFLSATVAVYFLAVIVVFPYIFTDGVDRLSVKLENSLTEKNIPVAVSWRLDPQEIELYIDKPVYVVRESAFLGEGASKVGIEETRGDSPFFYLILAEKEHQEYLDMFLSHIKKTERTPVAYSILSSDWRWRKTINFKDFLYNTIKNPLEVKKYFINAFQEKVYLLEVKRK